MIGHAATTVIEKEKKIETMIEKEKKIEGNIIPSSIVCIG